MTNEKSQKIAIYAIIAIIILTIFGVGAYFVSNYMKWQDYRNDPNKERFVSQIEEILAKKEKTGDDLLTLGNDYYQLGENDLAISFYKKALETEAKDVAGLNLVNAYIAKKDYKKAESQLLYILEEKNYADSSLYIKLADLYRLDWKGKKNDTLGVLMEFYNKAPGNVDILARIADYYAGTGEKDKAVEFYKKVLEIVPDNESVKQEIERLNK